MNRDATTSDDGAEVPGEDEPHGPTRGEVVFAIVFYITAAGIIWPLGLSERADLLELSIIPTIGFLGLPAIWARPLARVWVTFERGILGRFAHSEGYVVLVFYIGGVVAALVTFVGILKAIRFAYFEVPYCFLACLS